LPVSSNLSTFSLFSSATYLVHLGLLYLLLSLLPSIFSIIHHFNQSLSGLYSISHNLHCCSFQLIIYMAPDACDVWVTSRGIRVANLSTNFNAMVHFCSHYAYWILLQDTVHIFRTISSLSPSRHTSMKALDQYTVECTY
jgi:hypothetical protein